tara:strand:- start:93 stop:839 length:747 start_codon:yes stop_codon:yes gene_type:complete
LKIEAEDLDFSGKRVLITGAASGIGAEMAKTFGEHGASLILADIAKIQKGDCEKLSGLEKTIQFDQADPKSIAKMATEVGRVDILLNNAGVVWMGPFEEMSELDINRVISINLVGHISVAQKIGKSMLEQGSGVIINTSSQLAFHGAAERAVYAATKAGVSQFTKSIAAEWASKGVRVAGIAPGRTLTALNKNALDTHSKRNIALQGIPVGRFAEAHEMAKLALLLSSNLLNYVVGETIISDGGYVLL